jgi:hypothetical protein
MYWPATRRSRFSRAEIPAALAICQPKMLLQPMKFPPPPTYARGIAWDSYSPQPQLSVPNVMVPSEMRDTSNPDEPSQRYFMRYPSHDDEMDTD